MSDFVYDLLDAPPTKTNNRRAIPGLEGKSARAEDWNEVVADLESLRSAVLTGQWHGFDPRDAGEITALSEAGTYRVAVRNSDKHLVFWDGDTLHDLLSGGVGGGHTITDGVDDFAQRAKLGFVQGLQVEDSEGDDTTYVGHAILYLGGEGPYDYARVEVDPWGHVYAFSETTAAIGETRHGSLPGGSTHALAIASGAAGFLSGSDKAKLDGLPSAAVPAARVLSMSGDLTIAGGSSADLSADRTIALLNTFSPKVIQTAEAAAAGTQALTANKRSGSAGAANVVQRWQRDGTDLLVFQFDASDNPVLLPADEKSVMIWAGDQAAAIPALWVDKAKLGTADNVVQAWSLDGGDAPLLAVRANASDEPELYSAAELTVQTLGLSILTGTIINPPADTIGLTIYQYDEGGGSLTYPAIWLRNSTDSGATTSTFSHASPVLYFTDYTNTGSGGEPVTPTQHAWAFYSSGVDMLLTKAFGGAGLLAVQSTGTTTSTPVNVLSLTYLTTTAADGIGTGILLRTEDGSGNAQDAGRIVSTLTEVDHGSELGHTSLWAANGSGSLGAGLYAWGSGRVGIGHSTAPDALLDVESATASVYGIEVHKNLAATTDNRLMRFRLNGTDHTTLSLDNASAVDKLVVNTQSGSFWSFFNNGAGVLHVGSTGLTFFSTKAIALSTGAISGTSNITPVATETYDLGSSSLGWDETFTHYIKRAGHSDQIIELGTNTENWIKFTTNATESYRIEDGFLKNMVSANQVTTVGAAGGASAQPATPLGYLKVKLHDGTTVHVPYHTAA